MGTLQSQEKTFASLATHRYKVGVKKPEPWSEELSKITSRTRLRERLWEKLQLAKEPHSARELAVQANCTEVAVRTFLEDLEKEGYVGSHPQPRRKAIRYLWSGKVLPKPTRKPFPNGKRSVTLMWEDDKDAKNIIRITIEGLPAHGKLRQVPTRP